MGFVGFVWGCFGDIAMAYLMDCYFDMVLEGMVCIVIINNTIFCIFIFICFDWLVVFGIENIYIVLVVINFGIIVFVLLMYYYGKRIRFWIKRWYL